MIIQKIYGLAKTTDTELLDDRLELKGLTGQTLL